MATRLVKPSDFAYAGNDKTRAQDIARLEKTYILTREDIIKINSHNAAWKLDEGHKMYEYYVKKSEKDSNF